MYFYYYHTKKSAYEAGSSFSAAQPQQKSHERAVLLQEALQHYNDAEKLELAHGELAGLKIAKGPHGKPYIQEQEHLGLGLHFSISHSGDWWACIVGSEELGLDIEDMGRPKQGVLGQPMEEKTKQVRYEAIANRFFTEAEYEYVKSSGKEGFFDLWVRKEAYIKWKGTGLAEGLNSFEAISGGILSEQVNGVCFQEINLAPQLKTVYCTAGKKQIHAMVELFLPEQTEGEEIGRD